MRTQTYSCQWCGVVVEKALTPGRRVQNPKWCDACRVLSKRVDFRKQCAACGRLGVRRDARFCSQRCQGLATADSVITRMARARRRLAAAKRGTARTGAPFVSGPCRMCGRTFTAYWPVACCSARCTADNKKRLAIGRKAIRRLAIFERDNYRCGLCGKQTKRDAKVPHPRAPVVDHILPRIKGGSDDPANLQCAHFLCNSAKGERVWRDAEQLRLVS